MTPDVKHLLWLGRELGQDVVDMLVVTTGPRAYRRPDGIAVVPLAYRVASSLIHPGCCSP
jgi:hypothetical protein